MKTSYAWQLQRLAIATLEFDKPETAISGAAVRRSISTAYYAVFHHFVDHAVARLKIGRDPMQRAMRATAARSPNHARMRDVCQRFVSKNGARDTLPEDDRKGWPDPSASLVEAATAFISLQDMRHTADYDLAARISRDDADAAIKRAGSGLLALDDALRSDPWAPWFLLLMMADLKPRK